VRCRGRRWVGRPSVVACQARTITALHQAIIERSAGVLQADDRILAAWLEGSFAIGADDEWSDVDLHYAVADEHFDVACRDDEVRAVLTAVAEVLGANRLQFGPDLVLLNATIAGPLRVDLYAERRSFCSSHPRLSRARFLFDRGGLGDSFRVDPDAAALPPSFQLAGLVNRYAYGFMWPARLLGRRNYTTALTNASIIAHEFLVPALLAQEQPAQMHRELLSSERFLSNESRARIESILDRIASGYLTRATDDGAGLAAAHEILIDSILTELRAACARHDVDWPSTTEQEIRGYLREALDVDL
jgi:predicted nucleotidyltransferase